VDLLFLDACVLFSAAYNPVSPLLRLWKLKDAILLSSVYVLAEAERNLAALRPERMEALKRLEDQLKIVNASPRAAPEEAAHLPEKDLPVILSAITSKATHLLTVDKKHFGPFYGKTLGGVLVLTPGDYLREGQ
jgi:uncharacterized protein